MSYSDAPISANGLGALTFDPRVPLPPQGVPALPALALADYLGLVTTQHQDRPKFIASLTAALMPLLGAAELVKQIDEGFDVDTATGLQLDTIGEWVGRSRYIGVPITGVYFTWNGIATTGWNSAVWKGEFDPDSGLVSLPDDSYRVLIKAKIAANRWDGTVPGAYEVWSAAFGDASLIAIQDNQDMTMTLGISGPPLSAVTRALIAGGYIPLKPAGVQVNYTISPDSGPLFAWNVPNDSATAGWNSGRWGAPL